MTSKTVEIMTAKGPFKFSNEHSLKRFRVHLRRDHEKAKDVHEYYIGNPEQWYFEGNVTHPAHFFWSHRYTYSEELIDHIEQIDEPDWRTSARNNTRHEYWQVPYWPVEDAEERYAHLIKEGEQYLIRFIASAEHGLRGRLSTMKPGRYLTKYHPDLDAEFIKGIVAKLGQPEDVQWAISADDIVHVYENGPNSCMSGKTGDYKGHVHPCAVYGDSDLRLAYLSRNGRITARVLVWEDKKWFGRPYGDESRICRALEALGYQEGDFKGAKVRAIKNEDGRGWIMPYIDGYSRCQHEGDWFIIGQGDSDCHNTNGLGDQGPYCARMGQFYDEEDGYITADTDEFISQDAIDRGRGFIDDITGDAYYYTSNLIRLHDGRPIHCDTYRDHDGYRCSKTMEYYLGDEHPEVEFADDAFGRGACPQWAEENAYLVDGSWYLKDPAKASEESKEALTDSQATPVAQGPSLAAVVASLAA